MIRCIKLTIVKEDIGSCNFCLDTKTKSPSRPFFNISSMHPDRRTVVTICNVCLTTLAVDIQDLSNE